MKGDFTRITFRPGRRYTGVRMQQGRVQLDADWNEQADIQTHLDRTEATDVIGRAGAPKDASGFGIAVTPDDADLALSPGRFYVDGVLCELEAPDLPIASFPSAKEVELGHWPDDDSGLEPGRWAELSADGVPAELHKIAGADEATRVVTLDADVSAFDGPASPRLRPATTFLTQPDLPEPALAAPAADRTDLVYLDVWEHEVTAAEDPYLLEPALGGADTATRTRTVWQVRVEEGVTATDCGDVAGFPPEPSGARLTAEAPPSSTSTEPCVIPPGGGYHGLENRLYRVEIHSANGTGPTFKWSRDNGASVFAVEELLNEDATGTDRIRLRRVGRDDTLALAGGQTIEVLDDATVFTGSPGTIVEIDTLEEDRVLKLKAKVQGVSVARNARVRRWDGPPTDVDAGTTHDLEAGIEVTFGGADYASGDFWTFPARTAVGAIDELADAPPQGIRHRYAPLALVKWDTGGGGTTVEVEDCRTEFPSLTTLEAEDVGFSNDACTLTTTDGTPAETVQEALDVLCAGHGLRHHNAYLHGWGIVSGLKVVCDPDDRARVVVRPGWAIDRQGNDIEILETGLPFLDLVKDYDDDAAHTTKILNKGIGDAWLSWNPARGTGDERFAVEPYSSDWKKELNDRMSQTLLMEFYEDSIADVRRFFEEELTPPPGTEDDPTGPQHERVAALTNLFMQRVNPQAGQHILLTPREHKILADFYEGLKDELSLETFCGLFDDARPFPATFPAAISGVDTIFGRGQHQRLRLRSGGNEAYSVGPGLSPTKPATTVNRWDLNNRKLLAQFNPFAGEAGTKANTGMSSVLDVALSPDGKKIYAVASTKNQEDTLFRVGTIGSKDIRWGDVFTICDLKIVTLATTGSDKDKVYGIAHKRVGTTSKKTNGDGLYRIDPDALAGGTQPVLVGASFNSIGHLRIHPKTGKAWASEGAAGAEAKVYTGVRVFSNVALASPAVSTIPLGGVSGKDDIAVWAVEDGAPDETIYAIADVSGGKQLLAYRGTTRIAQVPVENTAIRLEPYPPTGQLLMTAEDGFAVRLVNMKSHAKTKNFVPTQLGPIAITSDAKQVYVLNYLSSTLTVADGRLFGTSSFPVSALAAYRKAAVEAYNDLLARFLEYLKDCLCEHLLVANPDTDGDTTLYLAAVSVRVPREGGAKDSRVYKVCNLSRRRYVKSFPAIGHWLSLVPVLPFLDLMVELFCCWVMPDTFGRYAVADFDESASEDPSVRFRIGTAREGTDTLQAFDALGAVSGLFGKFMEMKDVARDST